MASKPREIALCGFAHSGVEWLEKILTFLTYRKPGANQTDLKIVGYTNKLPASFPESWFSFQNKIVFIVRNPKDVAAASYCTSMGYNEDVFGGFLENFVSSGSLSLSAMTWFDHTQQWGECLKILPNQTAHLVYFENLVQNFREELIKLCSFLELPYDASCIDKCFNTLNIDELIQSDGPQRKRRKTEDHTQTSHIALTYESGTWKRLFTVGQSEQFDNYVRSAMKNSPVNVDVYL